MGIWQHQSMQVHGQSLAIVHIHQRTLKMCMACLGGANAVLGELVHGLAAQVRQQLPHHCQNFVEHQIRSGRVSQSPISGATPQHVQVMFTLELCAGG